MAQQRGVAHWNKDSGTLWVEPADGGGAQRIADGSANLEDARTVLAFLGHAVDGPGGLPPACVTASPKVSIP
ncbi:hypothetical protein [Mycolicibacterium sp.]|uniref:hypothetical protein n=1 Tax=Mycolicibacterium sp. TaxID=2320850 RepID=UPI003560A213